MFASHSITRRTFTATLAAVATTTLSRTSFAETYPSRPVRILVPYAPGGGTDLITRSLADIVSHAWNASVVIENRPGGGTTIATMTALGAAPDGYTLLAISNGFLISPLMMTPPPYVWNRDFTGVSLFAVSPHILVVHPSVPAKNFAEFVSWARSEGDKATYASFGNGSSNQIGFEMLKHTLGLKTTHVPYKGSAPALNDLVAGHVKCMLADLQNVSEFLKAGALRPIAVANEKRLPSQPDVPTFDELGVKGFTSKSLFGAVARKGTPPAIVAKWSAAFADALKQPALQQRLGHLGIELVGATPEQTNAFLSAEAAKAEQAVKDSGAKIE
ncbi:MAG TPA: tripartite tricarboxylate transporter substrate binding protein [Nitrobacter sp.]|jgi:tripartite-type tricarboxylate transporter receptor subunit TctC|nr:tripartite tricarboxylate transporter substrate binding protein [Nitrobacter sp.]